MGAAGHGVFAVDGVVGELIDVGVGFVGDAFAVAVDVYAGKGGGFDAVFA